MNDDSALAISSAQVALANVRGLSDAALDELLRDAAAANTEALEWANARIGDLEQATGDLRAIIAAGLEAGGFRTIEAQAEHEGISRLSLRSRLSRTPERYTVIPGPNPGIKGPRWIDWVRPR